MTTTVFEITVSLDGYVAGPDPTLDAPLGAGGERLHEWAVGTAYWREQHGLEGGERNADDELVRAQVDSTGAVVMGRRMFSGGSGGWDDDPVANGWWGDEPPFGVPVFVLTHHRRPPLVLGRTTFTFVTDGVADAHARALAAADGRNVHVAGGAEIGQQLLEAGLVDELQLHVAPTLLGDGTRLFERIDPARLRLEPIRALHSPLATHVRYRVLR
jgi:dihydrofolate reductase